MKIGIILGTRPEIIKMSPVIHECQKKRLPFFILHTGQHYSPNMDSIFFKELSLPEPDYNLKLGTLSYRKQVGFFIKHISHVLKIEKPDIVIVQGDTVTVVTGALAANNLGIPVAHHEAGLRSHDITMLEEVNRTLTDHVSRFLFAPTRTAFNNLIDEGFNKDNVFLAGNTIVDMVKSHSPRIKKSKILARLKLRSGRYFLITAHRAETVDKKEHLARLFESLSHLQDNFKEFKMLYVIHPRTEKMAEKFGLELSPLIRTIPPIGYFDMLALQKNANLILTDSGGVQEEACILGVPCVTLRDNTERPETIEIGANYLAGMDSNRILEAVKKILRKKRKWRHPFGDGRTGKKVLEVLLARTHPKTYQGSID